MKKFVDPFEHAGQICKAMKRGILVTAAADGKVNPMTIGWGTLGIEWGKPIFVAYVREGRFTRTLLDKNPEFTVNIPVGEVDGNILGFCGTKSGRDEDKVAVLGLTLEEPVEISVPGIRQLPLTLECRVLFRQKQELMTLPADLLDKYYPQNVDGADTGRNRDFHIAYYGEIVNAYLIKD